MDKTEVVCRIELSAAKINAVASAMEDMFPLYDEGNLDRLYALVLALRDHTAELVGLVDQV